MRRIAFFLILAATLEACGAAGMPRRPGGGNRGSREQPPSEQPDGDDGGVWREAGGRPGGGAGAPPAQEPGGDPRARQQAPPPPPLGSARPEIEPRPNVRVVFPAPQMQPLPEWLKPEPQGPDFRVDFAAPGSEFPTGLHAGMNDLLQASPGAWKVWAEDLPQKDAGLVRLWLRYHNQGLHQSHFRAAEYARECGLSVFVTVVGVGPQAERIAGDASSPLHPVTPADLEQWCRRVAGDIEKMRARGVDVRYVELWNEPDYAVNWEGTDEQFATFFATAGRRLRELLPRGTRIGGPSMGTGYGGGRRLFKKILEASVREGFEPDFLSWHDYPGFPSDQDVMDIPGENRRLADASGLTIPELIVSEWSQGMPPDPRLDDNFGAANYVAMVIAMARSEVRDAMFFFLQDGYWEADRDFGGQSLGIFTLNGAPKALLTGVRMVRQASSLPMVPSERVAGPNNLSLMASRQGDRGYLLATNIDGEAPYTARKLAEVLGVELSDYNGREEEVQRYLKGQAEWTSLDAPASHEYVWQAVGRFLQIYVRESKAKTRTVRVELEDGPRSVGKVWLLDATHGNPIESQDILQALEPYRAGWRNLAMVRTRATLAAEGVSAAQLDTLARAYKDRDPEAVAGLPAELRERAKTLFEQELERIKHEATPRFSAMADAKPVEVPAAGRAVLRSGVLELQLPPGTTLLVECLWGSRGD